METKTWFRPGPLSTRVCRRPSDPSPVEGWSVLEPRYGGRPVFVGRVTSDPKPAKSELVLRGSFADYEDALVRASKDDSGSADDGVEAAREKVLQAIREAPVKVKSSPIDGVEAPIRPRSFSTTAKAAMTE